MRVYALYWHVATLNNIANDTLNFMIRLSNILEDDVIFLVGCCNEIILR